MKRPKTAKRQAEVWVAPDLMQKMKGADGNRGVHAPQSPYLMLADQFLGLEPHDGASSKPGHKPAAQSHRSRSAGVGSEPPRALAAAAGAGYDLAHPVFSSIPPRVSYPKPPGRPTPPHPPRLAAPRPNPPKPPKPSFTRRRGKVDRGDAPE